jgi:hypothetical protein
MNQKSILKWSLIVSIVIIANLFFNYTLALVFNNPVYDEYCTFEKTSQIIETKEMCEQADGIWNPEINRKDIDMLVPAGYCDLYTKCNHLYEEASKIYEQKVFIALVVIGLLTLVVSFVIKNSTTLSSALALTAVLNFIVASIRYWRYSDEILKVVILFFALVTLVYIALKKFQDNN